MRSKLIFEPTEEVRRSKVRINVAQTFIIRQPALSCMLKDLIFAGVFRFAATI